MKKVGTILLIGLVIAGGFTLAADPSLDDVLAKHAAAMGGKDKLSTVKGVKYTGMIEFNGFEHPFEMVQAGQGRYRWQAEGMTRYGTSLELGRFMIVGCDGKDGWVQFGTEEPVALIDLPAPRTNYLKSEAEPLNSLLAPLKDGQSRKLAGKVDVDGQDAWHIRVEMGEGFVEHWYLDTETYLPFRMVVDMPVREDRTVERVWYFEDYRAVNGIQVPHYMEREDSQFVRTHHVESVEFNPDVSGVAFAKPAEK